MFWLIIDKNTQQHFLTSPVVLALPGWIRVLDKTFVLNLEHISFQMNDNHHPTLSKSL